MHIIKVHHKQSRPVPSYLKIEELAYDLKKFADQGPFVGEHQGCLALHHSQVSNDPFNFFVLSKQGEEVMRVAGLDFGWLVMDPIISLDGAVKITEQEGCMSWPFRKQKNILRFNSISASFSTEGNGRVFAFEGKFSGLPARIFQHEVDHGKGRTIYD